MRNNDVSSKKKNSKKKAESPSAAEQILTNAQSSRDVVQDFCPLAESLEWELGQQYLRQRGNKAFISDASPVPFVINNDGSLSRNAAEVFFTSIEEAEKSGSLKPNDEIFVLELGIGVGLFARFFLDRFRDLCGEHKKDYYHRLTYIAADKSERMLFDVARHGVLGNHVGRYRLRVVDAMQPGEYLPQDLCFLNHDGKPFRAVFLNYLLDCLPAAALEFDGDKVKHLCVRTCVARGVKLADHTDLTVEALAERAKKTDDPIARQELLEVYGLFASEYDYRTVDVKELPHGEFAYQFGKPWLKRLLHSYGAIQSLERLLELVRDDGFILINDYGQEQLGQEDEFEHQRFSLATFVGINFPLVRKFFTQAGKAWCEPYGTVLTGIHSRLLGHDPAVATRIKFSEEFGQKLFEKRNLPLAMARECARVGRFELAATYYQQAMEKQPANWLLLNEISMFLTFSLRDPKAGIDMGKVALSLNPTCSAELWSTLGDGLFEFGRYAEARSAYLKALQVNDSDVRARYNLAWTYQREKNFPAALQIIAEGLALDKTGEYTERLVQKQHEILTQVQMKHQQEYLLLINLVSRYAKKDDDAPKPNRQLSSATEGPTSTT